MVLHTSLFFALLSMLFAGINDLLFKKYGDDPNCSVGFFLIIIGIVWAAVFAVRAYYVHPAHISSTSIVIGIISGVCSITSNILLIESMKKTGASFGALVYRLNLVFVAVMAYVFLDESFTGFKIAGITSAAAAIIMYSLSGMKERTHDAAARIPFQCILLLLFASFLRACMGISYKIAGNAGVDNNVFLAVNGAVWIIGGFIYLMFNERNKTTGFRTIQLGAVSGVLVIGIVLCMKLAVDLGEASIAVTVTQLSFLVTAFLAALWCGEKLTPFKIAGILLALCGVLFFAAAG